MAGIRTALVQMKVEGGNPDANLRRAEERIREAATTGAKLIVLPEAMDLGWTHPSAAHRAEPVPDGGVARRLSAAAAESRVLLCAGLTERERSAVFNTAVLFGPDGRLLGRHRKLNELEIAHPLYAQGDRLTSIQTDAAAFGLLICADAFARDHVLLRALGYLGVDVVLSPCAWAVPGDHDNRRDPYGALWESCYCPVAREFSLWIVAVSCVGPIERGPWAGRICIGASMVVDPCGDVVLRGNYGADADELQLIDITPVHPRPARGCGWEHHPARP